MQSQWTWVVVYDDGQTVFEDDLIEFNKVDMERVQLLIVQRRSIPELHYVVSMQDGMRPIFFRRTRTIQVNDPTTIPEGYVHDGQFSPSYEFATVLGWQKTVAGRNVKSLTWLIHDGSIAVTDRDIDELT